MVSALDPQPVQPTCVYPPPVILAPQAATSACRRIFSIEGHAAS